MALNRVEQVAKSYITLVLSGKAEPLEELIRHNPDVRYNDVMEAIIAVICDEYFHRKDQGEEPVMQDYLDRYPELAVQIADDIESTELIRDLAEDESIPHAGDIVGRMWTNIRRKVYAELKRRAFSE